MTRLSDAQRAIADERQRELEYFRVAALQQLFYLIDTRKLPAEALLTGHILTPATLPRE